MTSSLVGSEMCIRDRIWSGILPGGTRHKRGRGVSHGAGSRGRGPPGGCLLYTSDAADECRSRWS
eukprot:4530947-Prorocentrum_lima.AAC.1